MPPAYGVEVFSNFVALGDVDNAQKDRHLWLWKVCIWDSLCFPSYSYFKEYGNVNINRDCLQINKDYANIIYSYGL